MRNLPKPSQEESILSDNLIKIIIEKINQSEEKNISFYEYMKLALYTPNLGYYNNFRPKIGVHGDFTTAPEISNLFSHTLAKYCISSSLELDCFNIIEFGAGTGKMALEIINYCYSVNKPIQNYYILETSGFLTNTQKTTLKKAKGTTNIQWLQKIPNESLEAVVIANEVLDAMPVHKFLYNENKIYLEHIEYNHSNNSFSIQNVEAPQNIHNILLPKLSDIGSPYISEFNPNLSGWLKAIASKLIKGTLIICDYGFEQAQYYHPSRSSGTIMCHYKNHTNCDYLLWPGLQDITSHVDFTAVAEAASNFSFQVIEYLNMAEFLLQNGILELEINSYREKQAINTFTSPAEMGELFKFLILKKD